MESSEIEKTTEVNDVMESLQLLPHVETVRGVQEGLQRLSDEYRYQAIPIINLISRIRSIIMTLAVFRGKYAFCERFIEYRLDKEGVEAALEYLRKRGYDAELVFQSGSNDFTIKVSWEKKA